MTIITRPFQHLAADGSRVPGMQLGPVEVYFGEHNGKFPDGNQLVVRGTDAVAVLDTPLVSRRIPDVLNAADLVVLGHVHEDHTCALRELSTIPVHVPREDAPALISRSGLAAHYGYRPEVAAEMVARAERDFCFAPRPDAIPYDHGDRWELGGAILEAIHMPGHTSGHSVLWIEPGAIAFIGDIDLSGFGPYYGDATSDLSSFRQTLLRVRDVPARIWITSHHKGVVSSHDEFIALLDRFAAVLDRRDEAILSALNQPRTLDDLVSQRFVYPRSYQNLFVDDVERRVLTQHLAALAQNGRVRTDGALWRTI